MEKIGTPSLRPLSRSSLHRHWRKIGLISLLSLAGCAMGPAPEQGEAVDVNRLSKNMDTVLKSEAQQRSINADHDQRYQRLEKELASLRGELEMVRHDLRRAPAAAQPPQAAPGHDPQAAAGGWPANPAVPAGYAPPPPAGGAVVGGVVAGGAAAVAGGAAPFPQQAAGAAPASGHPQPPQAGSPYPTVSGTITTASAKGTVTQPGYGGPGAASNVMPPAVATTQPVAPAKNDSPPPAEAAIKSPQQAYDDAFVFLKGGNYDQALSSFDQFLKRFPNDQLAANAQYWVGDIHFVQRRFPEALQSLNQVLVRWPNSEKVPHSLLKIGLAFYELEDMTNAKVSLDRLVKDYPDSPAATTAKQRLKMIQQKSSVR